MTSIVNRSPVLADIDMDEVRKRLEHAGRPSARMLGDSWQCRLAIIEEAPRTSDKADQRYGAGGKWMTQRCQWCGDPCSHNASLCLKCARQNRNAQQTEVYRCPICDKVITPNAKACRRHSNQVRRMESK